MNTIAERLARVRREIDTSARSCGRDPEKIRLLAVSKTFPPEIVEEAAAAGQTWFGENRVQEAFAKIPKVRSRGLHWHLIGHLQSNKARRAVELFEGIETLDRPGIVRKLGSLAEELDKTLEVLVQVNVGEESQKSGVDPHSAESLVELVDQFPRLQLRGLMTIPPYFADAEKCRPYFRQLRKVFDQINLGRSEPLTELSMGMSHDFRVAIQEGATLVRVGTAVFGARG